MNSRPPAVGARSAPLDGCAVLLVAHGSRSAAGNAETEHLARTFADLCPGTEVRLGYLELCDPPAAAVLDDLARAGAERIVVLPAMLYSAGHTKSDVPAVILDGRAAHRGVEIFYGRPLGADYDLLDVARRRIEAAGGGGLPLAVLSRGTSDPDANAEAYKVGRLLADMVSSRPVVSGFSGVTWPGVPDALRQLHALGAERVTTFSWFLATGVLLERMRDDYAEFSESTGVEVVDAGYLGTGREVADLLVQRAVEALSGRVAVNCDLCAYRAPFPGLEDRVGAPLGAGHSHLASAHRHRPAG